jgi:hypothetical protein
MTIEMKDFFVKKYLSVQDIFDVTKSNTAKTFKVIDLKAESVIDSDGTEIKKNALMFFEGQKLPMVLNKMNLYTLRLMYSEDINDVIGKEIKIGFKSYFIEGQRKYGFEILP